MSHGLSRRRISALAMMTLPLAAVGLLARNVKAQLLTVKPAVPVINGPSSWVPFQAQVRVSHPGEPLIHGRYFRAQDGSERLETGPSLDDVRVVMIKNAAQRLLFTGHPKTNTWSEQPYVPPAKPPVGYRLPTWSLHPYKLALMKGQDGSLMASEGFSAYEVKSGSGIVVFKVPELNFFDAIRQRPDGRYEIYSDIELKQPDWALFQIPAGVAVQERQPSTPTGVPAVPAH